MTGRQGRRERLALRRRRTNLARSMYPSTVRDWQADAVRVHHAVPFLSHSASADPNTMTCHYCASPAQARDHVFPRYLGGVWLWWNLVPTCHACNTAKGDTSRWCRCAFCLRALRRGTFVIAALALDRDDAAS